MRWSNTCTDDMLGISGFYPKFVKKYVNITRVIEKAVKRMLPGGPLSRKQMTNLRIYKGTNHPHEGQSPETLNFKDIKNSAIGIRS